MSWEHVSKIPGYELFNYEFNIAGEIRHCKTKIIRKWQINTPGYYFVRLSSGSLHKSLLQHRALCFLFIPNPEGKPWIDHIDRNRLNNSLDNLRWVTCSENNQNMSLSSNNTSGEQNIHKAFNHGKPIWRVMIEVKGKEYKKVFHRDLESENIPQKVIDMRDKMKRDLHI
jgi:hypothetical protein